jgi:hypothetical protein
VTGPANKVHPSRYVDGSRKSDTVRVHLQKGVLLFLNALRVAITGSGVPVQLATANIAVAK